MSEIKAQIKEWIIDKKKIQDASILNNATALLDTQILKSIDVMDLIIFIEFLRDAPLQITELKPGAFHSIDAIAEHFFAAEQA
jgi:acyl carrier protein